MPLSYQAIESGLDTIRFYDVDGTRWETDGTQSDVGGDSGGTLYYDGWVYIIGNMRDDSNALPDHSGRKNIARWNPDTDEVQVMDYLVLSGGHHWLNTPFVMDFGRGEEVCFTFHGRVVCIDPDTFTVTEEKNYAIIGSNNIYSIHHREIDGTSYLFLLRVDAGTPLEYAEWSPGDALPDHSNFTTIDTMHFSLQPVMTKHGVLAQTSDAPGAATSRAIGYLDLSDINNPTATLIADDAQRCAGILDDDGRVMLCLSFRSDLSNTTVPINLGDLTQEQIEGTMFVCRWDEDEDTVSDFTIIPNTWRSGSNAMVGPVTKTPGGDYIVPGNISTSDLDKNAVMVLDKDDFSVKYSVTNKSFLGMDSNDENSLRSLRKWSATPNNILTTSRPAGSGMISNLIIWNAAVEMEFEEELEFDILPPSLAPAEHQIRAFIGDELVPSDEWEVHNGVFRTLVDKPASADILVIRETRTYQSWVNWERTSKIHQATDLNSYYKQRLFIFQELCELPEVADLMGVSYPTPDPPERPSTMYKKVTSDADSPIPISEFEFLPAAMTGGAQHQLKVYVEVGISRLDLTYTTEAAPSNNEWTLNNDGEVVVNVDASYGTEDAPLIIERSTRKDQLWYTFRNAEGLSSHIIGLVEMQLRFLFEESCALINLPADHVLGQPLWPRVLNWLTFRGPQGLIRFGQFGWSEGDGIRVFVNDIPVEDYTIDWDTMTIDLSGLTDLDEEDLIKITPGGGNSFVPPTDFGGGTDTGGDSGEGDNSTSGDLHGPSNSLQWGPAPIPPTGTVSPFVWTGLPLWGGLSDPTLGSNSSTWRGLRYTETTTGREFIMAGFIQCSTDTPGLTRWVNHISWSKNEEGNWTKVGENTITPCVQAPPIVPSWVAAVRDSIQAAYPAFHPVNQLTQTANLREFQGEPVSNIGKFINDKGQEIANSIEGFTDPSQITQDDYMDWINQK